MIINPIIPIWIMLIICLISITIILYDKHTKKFGNFKKNLIKLLIILMLFIINLRLMIPNGEAMAVNSDLSVLFVIDTSVSMRALDYDGGKERLEGIRNDCNLIIDELSGSKFSIITFGDSAKKIIPFTIDSDMVKAEINSLVLENDFYAKGTSINLVKDTLENTLKSEAEKENGTTKFIVFFITDGEITKDNENLSSFESIKPYILDGAVLGYGTYEGGKMVNSTYVDDPSSEFYYLYYHDENYDMKTAISKLDEGNLKKLSQDMGIDYIKMDKTTNINSKLKDINKQMSSQEISENKINVYKDIYYYFAIPLVILLIVDFIFKKRKL